MGLALKMVQKLQKMQNAVVRVFTTAKQSDSTSPQLRGLHWLPICSWAQFRVLVWPSKPFMVWGQVIWEIAFSHIFQPTLLGDRRVFPPSATFLPGLDWQTGVSLLGSGALIMELLPGEWIHFSLMTVGQWFKMFCSIWLVGHGLSLATPWI